MAKSALNLRLALALGGTVLCVVLGVLVWRAFGAVLSLPLFVLAVVGAVDAVVVQRRRAARARAHVGKDHTHDSLFE